MKFSDHPHAWTSALVMAIIVLAAAGVASGSFVLRKGEEPPSVVPVPSSGSITVAGIVLCLPHKDTGGPYTLECAFGLRDSLGRYFALRDTDPQYRNITGIPMNMPVEVEGTFEKRGSSKYQDIGIIAVKRITPLASSTPQ